MEICPRCLGASGYEDERVIGLVTMEHGGFTGVDRHLGQPVTETVWVTCEHCDGDGVVESLSTRDRATGELGGED